MSLEFSYLTTAVLTAVLIILEDFTDIAGINKSKELKHRTKHVNTHSSVLFVNVKKRDQWEALTARNTCKAELTTSMYW